MRKSLFDSAENPLSQLRKLSLAAPSSLYTRLSTTCAKLAYSRFSASHVPPSRLRTILARAGLTLRAFLVDHTHTYARYSPLLYATSSGQPRRTTPHHPRHTAAPRSSCTRHTAHKRLRPYKKEVKGRCGIIFLQKNLVV